MSREELEELPYKELCRLRDLAVADATRAAGWEHWNVYAQATAQADEIMSVIEKRLIAGNVE